jgi:hypothetical protein
MNFDGDVHATTGRPLEDLVLLASSGTIAPTFYVVYGAADLAQRGTLATTDAANLAITYGAPAGTPIARGAAAGDLDADGRDDLVVTYIQAAQDGEAFLLYGAAGLSGTRDVASSLELAGGDTVDSKFGTAVVFDDVSGDGVDDAIVGDNLVQQLYVFDGPGQAAGQVNPPLAHVVVGGGGQFGNSLAATGDISGDGLADVVSGAASSLRFVFGTGVSLSDRVSLEYTVQGRTAFGAQVAGPGDFDGDGHGDVLTADTDGAGTVFLLR